MNSSATLISSTAATVAARLIGGMWLPSMRVMGADLKWHPNGGTGCPTTTTTRTTTSPSKT